MQMSSSIWDEYQAIVLAGGFGTRIKHLLGDLPKPMAPVNGSPFLFWVIENLLRQKIKQIAISTHYQAKSIEVFVDKCFDKNNIKCIKEDFPRGTAGAVLHVRSSLRREYNLCKSKFLVLNGDSLIVGDLSGAVRKLTDGIDCVIIGLQVSDTGRYGRLEIDEDDNLLRFEEKRSGAGIINAGVYLIRGNLLDDFDSFESPISFEYDFFPKIISKKKKIKIYLMNCPFIDIGTENSLADASNFISDNFNG
jgi:D-glycero-alpha-D-manno-heptose 1-phosphate guanylyltransferase